MKIFLGNAPWRKENKIGVRAGSRWPHFQPIGRDGIRPDYLPFPFFLSYAAAVLERAGFSVMVRDAVASGDTLAKFIKSAQTFSPDLILLETSTPTIKIDLNTAETMHSAIPSSLIAFSGPHNPMFKTEFLEENPNIDFILYGEYELTLLELVQKLQSKQSLDNIHGLIFRIQTSLAQKNPPRPLIENLDSLPFPARHLFPIMHYNDSVCNLPRPNLQMWASRGCPFQCNFCAWPQIMYGGKKYRARNPVSVAEEMDTEVKKYGFKGVYFDDDTFNLQKSRVIQLCEEICRRNLPKRVAWAVMARADAMDDELLEVFKKAGLYAVKYGVESGSQEILNNMGKKLNLEKVERVVRKTKELGIRVHLTFSFGHQGETKETINKTIKTALRWEPDAVQFSIITPFPGSRYYDILEREKKLETTDWEHFNGSHSAVFHTDRLSANDLEEARKNACRRWEIETEQKNNQKLKENISDWIKQNKIFFNDCSEILIIRSSFLAHTKKVVETFANSLPQIPLYMLAQKGIANDLKTWKLIHKVYIYDKEHFHIKNLSKIIIQTISQKKNLMLLVLYNNSDGTGYENVYEMISPLKGKKIISANPQGNISVIKE